MRIDEKAGSLTFAGGFSDDARLCVERTLKEITLSPPFRTSRQCQDLLRYIVLHSLQGEEESLRERVIGVEVFGRRAAYDQTSDPVVRLRAADVRKRLAQYYVGAYGAAHRVRISIPLGSYKASFEFTDPPVEEIAPAPMPQEVIHSEPAAAPPAPRIQTEMESHGRIHRVRPLWIAVPAIVAAVLISITLSMLLRWTPETNSDRFWSPVLKSSRQILVYVGSNAVYTLSDDYLDAYRAARPMSKEQMRGREFVVPLGANDMVPGKDLLPITDTYVTVGDLAATTRITSLLSSRKKAYDMRAGEDISVGDLRERPAILIGGFNNSWTLEMTDGLRFVFAYKYQIQDRADKKRSWRASPGFTEDYAIVSRILNSKTGEILISAAGIGQAGTRAAGEFLTDLKGLDAFLRLAPKGWEKKNMQIVLHTTVINGSPNQPDVVATYYW